jgi:hypothetical protein
VDLRIDGPAARVLAVRRAIPRVLPAPGRGLRKRVRGLMGFNAMQPGKSRGGDLLYLVAAIVVVALLVLWAVRA